MLLKRVLRRLLRRPASADFAVIDEPAARTLIEGWRESTVATRQQKAFAPLLENLRQGRVRQDFQALADAVKATGLTDPLLVEVGCGSGWNGEVLTRLLNRPVRYIGLDFSPSMLALARQAYPAGRFVTGDATALPLRDKSCDILVSGTSLMHILDYRDAIRETRRVMGRFCIFHTVPLLQRRSTTILRKKAYGTPSLEITFNESEFLALLAAQGLKVRQSFPSLPYDLQSVLGEPTTTRTFLCE